MRRIALGADHAGFGLKQAIAKHLAERSCVVEDCGTHSTDAVDYPDIAYAVARRVADGASDVGIIVDGAGIGSAMAANKVPGVRAALCYDLSSARNSREHNNANVLTLGAGLIGPGLATQIVDVFLDTQCTVERHLRRANMIAEIERRAAVPDRTRCDCGTAPCTCGSDGLGSAGTSNHAGGAAPRSGGGDKEDPLAELTDSDIQRVADRIARLLGTGRAGDTVARDVACGFCRTCAEIDPDLVRSFIELGADRIVHRGNGDQVPSDIAAYIDHTLLRSDATYEQIDRLCAEAAQFGFASVCVNPYYVRRCAGNLANTRVKVCTVVGFPLGANTSQTKALEARRAIRDGAREIDMVINVGALKSGDDDTVYRDIRAVVDASMDGGAICKVILETALLTDDEKLRACVAAVRAKADFVKTSTGFGPGGATADDVALMHQAVSDARLGVKASGGIRDLDQAQRMIQAGATRIGASAGVKIVKQSQGVTVSESGSDKY